ncbi:hypothetical protein [Kitasatospora sp. GP82]|uniref:hypothetical protein n=1 Tax=Kitasatospora sp. GP82 TaxID=3035089 RepID=UPI002473DDAE|nr:hypothetical protein [Kitasatospora sp. GP82]MDH6128059.1 hypothetical protein [Kitasatospora sp. GP82]
MHGRSPLSRPLAAAVGACAALAVLSGCSAASADGTGAPAPSPTPTTVESTDLHLPIADYIPSQADQTLYSKGAQVVLQECMKGYGLSFPDHYLGPKSAPSTITEMRYGVTSSARAKTTGYHFGPADPGYLDFTPPPDQPENRDQGYQLVLKGNGTPGKNEGTPTTYRSMTVPPGGCMGQMTKKLSAGATFLGEADLVKQINAKGFSQSMQEPAVQAVFKDWSSCMAGKGYHYATPMDAVNDPAFGGPKPAPGEPQTAQADLACKQQYNVVGVWYASEANQQRALMAQHAGELRTIKVQMQQQIAVASDVLRSASPSPSH